MVSWALVATVKAPAPQILAFVAHHLSLGAAEITLHFDDPEDPAFATIAALPRVTAIRCTDAYWQSQSGRHTRHQNRQARNARVVQKHCRHDWLGHLDVDEFLLPTRPLADILGAQDAKTLAIQFEPFEAMHDPSLPDDIFTARQFRGPLRDTHTDLRRPALRPFRAILPKGNLSHAAGKSFCRPAAPGLALRLHGVFLRGERMAVPFHPDVPLLHFHAQDRKAWLAALPFRLTRGAYQYHPALQSHLAGAADDVVQRLYDGTQILTAETIALLQSAGPLITADLGLRAKVAALQKGTLA